MKIENQLMADLVATLLQGRQMTHQLLSGSEMSIVEFMAMMRVAHNSVDSERNIYADDLQGMLFVSKPAVSQLLKSLEKRGLIRREINEQNRRKLDVTLTEAGTALLEDTKAHYMAMLREIIDTFGEEKTCEMVRLYAEFARTVREVTQKHERVAQAAQP